MIYTTLKMYKLFYFKIVPLCSFPFNYKTSMGFLQKKIKLYITYKVQVGTPAPSQGTLLPKVPTDDPLVGSLSAPWINLLMVKVTLHTLI